MKDIKKEKHEPVDWLGRIETASELISGGLYLKNLIRPGAAIAEDLVVGVGAAEGAGIASLIIPGVGVAAATLAAGSGLYHYAKKYLDEDPEDRRGKIIVDNIEMRQKRAEGLTNQMFDDGKYAQAFSV